MNAKIKLIISAALAGLLLLSSCLYIVSEGEQGLTLRLGELVLDRQHKPAVSLPGLHSKLPFISQVRIFDTRLQTLDVGAADANSAPPRIVTLEKKNVIVDYFVKWRIRDLALFYTRTSGSYLKAQALLAQQLNDGLRAEFGRRTINEVVSDDRTSIMDKLRTQANLTSQNLGIEVVDVRIKRIDLPEEVSTAIFDQMRAEREQVAAEHRSQGKADAEAIRAQADANATVTVATARADAAHIRGRGDQEAAKIYADAYNKNPGFYAFFRSLQAYRNSFANKQDVLVLRPDSQFFKYFNGEQTAQK